MDKVGTVTLVAQKSTHDDIGQEVMSDTKRTVYCTILSITRAEWATAHQRSFSPAVCLKVFFCDYQRETIAEFEGKRYSIYRTFGIGDYIELYLGTKAGDLDG